MGITLCCTWKPRGEISRFHQILPILNAHYSDIIISLLTPDQTIIKTLQSYRNVTAFQLHDMSHGRHAAIFAALDRPNEYAHYVDFDRLLRWIETYPEEIPVVINAIQHYEFLIIGRTAEAFATHAQALQQTEIIVNAVASHFLNQEVDTGGGSRGFHRSAIEFLKDHSTPGNAIGTDAEWPILLHRGGYRIGFTRVNGLTWEIPDRYKSHAVDSATQQEAAHSYDKDASRWRLRVSTAQEIIDSAIRAASQQIS